MKTLILTILCLAGTLLFGWGAGHDDHARLVLERLPSEITTQWNAKQTKELTTHWSHFPDSGVKNLSENKKTASILPKEDLIFLEKAGINGSYPFHQARGKAVAFYLLIKAFRTKNPDLSTFYAGILLHSTADAAAFNHGPLIHHYTYTSYKHVKSSLNQAMLDLSYMRKSPELQGMIEKRLKGFSPQPSGKNLEDTLVDVMLSEHMAAAYMCSIEHKLAMPSPACLEGMADIAAYQTREGSGLILQAWDLAKSNAKLDLAPEYFASKGELTLKAKLQEKLLPPRNPANDGIYDGLFAPVQYPAIGIICEATAPMNSAQLGFGSRFISAVCARSIRNSGRNIQMLPLDTLKEKTLNPKQLPILIVCSSNKVLPEFAEKTIKKYLDNGGKLVYIGGRGDSKLTGMHTNFLSKQDNELAVSSKYGKANEDIYVKMAVIRVRDGKRFNFKDNPNCQAGWNKPFSDIAIQPKDGIKPLFELDNGKERFCIAAANAKAVWLPQYLLMPFLFSEDVSMRDNAHPELDSFGTDVILNALKAWEK